MSIWRLGYVEVRSLDLERDSRFWHDEVRLATGGEIADWYYDHYLNS